MHDNAFELHLMAYSGKKTAALQKAALLLCCFQSRLLLRCAEVELQTCPGSWGGSGENEVL